MSEFFVIGLGNPGRKYSMTRHNVGFIFVEKFLKKYPPFSVTKKVDYILYSTNVDEIELSMVKPMTFMNESGLIFKSLYLVNPPIVVYDDLDLEIGKLRIRSSGSAGGHNGIKSVIQYLGTQDFPRIRIGIGPKKENAIYHVLGNFTPKEFAIIDEVIDICIEATVVILKEGIESAMNKYNSLKVVQ